VRETRLSLFWVSASRTRGSIRSSSCVSTVVGLGVKKALSGEIQARINSVGSTMMGPFKLGETDEASDENVEAPSDERSCDGGEGFEQQETTLPRRTGAGGERRDREREAGACLLSRCGWWDQSRGRAAWRSRSDVSWW